MDQGDHSIQWYVYDESEQEEHGTQWAVNTKWLHCTRNALDRVNLYVGCLRSFASVQNRECTALELCQPTATGKFAAIAHIANSNAIQPRSIVIWRDTDLEPSFINPLSPHYEPLQYPILFPHGTPGWGMIENEDGSYARTSPLTQTQYYRYHILTEPRFLTFG